MFKILKKYYIIMLIMLIPNCFIIFSCTYKTNYNITAPGGVSSVDYRFDITNGYESNNFLSLYVYSVNNATLFQKFIANCSDIYSVDVISDLYSHMTDSMWNQAGIIQKNQSLETSAIIAYQTASLIDSTISIDYDYLGVIVSLTSADNNVFLLGDIITHIDDIKIESLSHFKELKREIGTKITYIRDDIKYDYVLKDSDNWASAYYDKYNIKSSSPKYTINQTSSTGPSAGMMQTLSIYNKLISDDITLKDNVSRIISGTGTIESDGSIGAIGGVLQKVHSAYNSGASILLMSKDNEEEAIEAFNSLKNNTTMKLYIVNNFNEVLECLK